MRDLPSSRSAEDEARGGGRKAHSSATAITHRAVSRLVSCQSKPKPSEQANLANATTVWAAAIPLARLSSGTDWVASADSTPSVAA